MGEIGIRQQKREQLFEEIQKTMDANKGVTKASELYALGMDYRKVQSFVKEGRIKKIKNGYYALNDGSLSEETLLLSLFPDGVLTMESALFYYGYMLNRPFQWHIAIDKNTSKSRFKLEYPTVKPYYTEPKELELGVTEIQFGPGKMRIYDKERLICDCLKYEEKLDNDVLKKAMLKYIQEENKDIEKLMEYARQRKVVTKVQNRIGVWL